MDKKKILDKVKAIFSEDKEEVKADPITEEKLADEVTEDGVLLRTESGEIVEGEKVSIVSVNEEGVEEVVDAPEGEYIAGGKTVVVDAESVIVSVVSLEEEPKEEPEVVEEEEMSEAMPKWAESLVSRLDAIELSNSNLAENMSAIDELSKKVSEFGKEPADEEIKLKKALSKKQIKANSREEKLRFLSNRK